MRITEKELELLRMMAKLIEADPKRWGVLKAACELLRISYTQGKCRLWRLKTRYLRASRFLYEYRKWRTRLKGRFL